MLAGALLVTGLVVSPQVHAQEDEDKVEDVEVEVEEEVEPTPQDSAAQDLLEHSWLRRELQPESKRPTDSPEPMGLLNRIKGAFARSAGR